MILVAVALLAVVGIPAGAADRPPPTVGDTDEPALAVQLPSAPLRNPQTVIATITDARADVTTCAASLAPTVVTVASDADGGSGTSGPQGQDIQLPTQLDSGSDACTITVPLGSLPNGGYTLTVTVGDQRGESATAQTGLTIAVPVIGQPTVLQGGQSVTFPVTPPPGETIDPASIVLTVQGPDGNLVLPATYSIGVATVLVPKTLALDTYPVSIAAGDTAGDGALLDADATGAPLTLKIGFDLTPPASTQGPGSTPPQGVITITPSPTPSPPPPSPPPPSPPVTPARVPVARLQGLVLSLAPTGLSAGCLPAAVADTRARTCSAPPLGAAVLRVRTLRGVNLVARVRTLAGAPVAGVAISVLQLEASGARPLFVLRTDAQGNAAIPLTAGPSRLLRIQFAGDRSHAPSYADVQVRVPAATTILVDQVATLARAITFHGQLLSFAALMDGQTVRLEEQRPHQHWMVLGTTHSDGSGAWSIPVKLVFGPRDTYVRLRAAIVPTDGYPYTIGTSQVLMARLRGG